jgi:CRP-like cAMP-binding protein
LISLTKEYNIERILEILPPHLKGSVSQFLYFEAIETIRILKNRDVRFYGNYMSKFQPMSLKAGSIFASQGSSAQEVFFILKGCVESVNQNKFYLEGTLIGETDIILKRSRLETYKARNDSLHPLN